MKRKSAEPKLRIIPVLAVLLVALLVLATVVFVHVSETDRRNGEYLLRMTEQRVVAEQVAKNTLAAAAGDGKAFTTLLEGRDRFEALMSELKNGNPAVRLPPVPTDIAPKLREVENAWLALRQNADEVLASQDEILAVREQINVIGDVTPQLLDISGEVVRLLEAGEVPVRQVVVASRQMMLAQRIQGSLDRVFSGAGGKETASAIDRFGRDTEEFGKVLDGMIRGASGRDITAIEDPAARAKLKEIATLFATVNDYAARIVNNSPALLKAFDAVANVTRDSALVNAATGNFVSLLQADPGRWAVGNLKVGPTIVILLVILSVLAAIALTTAMLADAKKRTQESREQNEVNQQAILRLLDEMGGLADGDLSVQATVTEHVTGAIADSINYVIEALRNLVLTIDEAAKRVTTETEDARQTASEVQEASQQQAEQITSASSRISQITNTMQEMSGNAQESAQVAQRAVDLATNGAAAVQRTIDSMDTTRAQIQETAKRIKRLGESSQQIGEIVELIDDIADQTNILALNAAMQAAMAGEAGRGFAVVADEVQRLAERSGHATKQIETLVKTIQADTNQAVVSMESSTAGVVAGAGLAEDAGAALKEIENVSNYIADVTRRISNISREQADETASLNDGMSMIQEITAQTSNGTARTTESIVGLAALARELNKTVAGFRLP